MAIGLTQIGLDPIHLIPIGFSQDLDPDPYQNVTDLEHCP